LQGKKMQDVKMHDMKSQDKKYSVNRDYITLQWSVQLFVVVIFFVIFLETNTNALCVSYYLWEKGVSYYLL